MFILLFNLLIIKLTSICMPVRRAGPTLVINKRKIWSIMALNQRTSKPLHLWSGLYRRETILFLMALLILLLIWSLLIAGCWWRLAFLSLHTWYTILWNSSLARIVSNSLSLIRCSRVMVHYQSGLIPFPTSRRASTSQPVYEYGQAK